MRRILTIISGGENEANERLAALKKQFGDAQFEVEPYERKHRLIVNSDVDSPTFETMKRVANGYGSGTVTVVKQAPLPKSGLNVTGTSGRVPDRTTIPAPTKPVPLG